MSLKSDGKKETTKCTFMLVDCSFWKKYLWKDSGTLSKAMTASQRQPVCCKTKEPCHYWKCSGLSVHTRLTVGMWDMFRLDLTRNETGGCFLVRPSTSSNTWLKTDIMRLSYSLCVCTDPRGPYSWKLDQNQKRPVEAHFHCHAP